jgi:hypothetical protein
MSFVNSSMEIQELKMSARYYLISSFINRCPCLVHYFDEIGIFDRLFYNKIHRSLEKVFYEVKKTEMIFTFFQWGQVIFKTDQKINIAVFIKPVGTNTSESISFLNLMRPEYFLKFRQVALQQWLDHFSDFNCRKDNPGSWYFTVYRQDQLLFKRNPFAEVHYYQRNWVPVCDGMKYLFSCTINIFLSFRHQPTIS